MFHYSFLPSTVSSLIPSYFLHCLAFLPSPPFIFSSSPYPFSCWFLYSSILCLLPECIILLSIPLYFVLCPSLSIFINFPHLDAYFIPYPFFCLLPPLIPAYFTLFHFSCSPTFIFINFLSIMIFFPLNQLLMSG